MAEPSAMETPSTETPLGPQLPLRLGRFTLCEELGAGGMATVYLARMEMAGGLERLAALKTIHPHLAKEKAFVDMFLDEARIASHVGHPNVCSTYDFGEVNGVYYLAMEYLLGEPLFDVINRLVERFDDVQEVLPYLAARIIADAAEGLHAAHVARGPGGEQLHIVHRDVSPQNLFLTYEGSVKVVDFGCAKAAERVAHTSTGVMKGKVGYAAPEQLKSDHVDARADVWALGVCLWEALTLSPLFSRDTAVQTAMAVLQDDVERASDGRPWVPEAVAAIADRALRRDREERFGSARELSRALRRFIADSGYTLESAELAEWMDFLFEDRHETRIRQAARVRELDLSDVALHEVTAEDVELLEHEAEPEPLEALPVDEDDEHSEDDEHAEHAAALGDADDEPSHPPPLEGSGPIAKRVRAEAPDETPAPFRRGGRWALALVGLAALAAGGYWLQLHYQPAPWVYELVGLTPPAAPGDGTGGIADPASAPAAEGDAPPPDGEDAPRPAEVEAASGAAAGDGTTEPPTRAQEQGGDAARADRGEARGASTGGASAGGASTGGASTGGASAAGASAAGASNAGASNAGASNAGSPARGSRRRSGRGGGGGGRGSSVTTVVSGGGSSGAAGTTYGGAAPSSPGGRTGTSPAGSSGGSGSGASDAPLQGDRGILSLTTSSGWAEVYANGRPLGRTPVRRQLPSGRYRLRLLPYGEGPASYLPVHIEPGAESRLEIDVGPPPDG
jgi:serine/threonine-protein kinase